MTCPRRTPRSAILALPAATAASLALLPSYRLSAALNVASALVTFLAAPFRCSSNPPTGRLYSRRRSQHRLHRAQHVRRLHDERLQRELYRARARDRAADAAASALLSRDVPDIAVRDEPRAGRQQYRPDVGGDRNGDADDGADGRHLSHAGGDRGGLEIFHPRQRRHRAGPVRHDPRLYGGAAGRRRRRWTAWSGPP